MKLRKNILITFISAIISFFVIYGGLSFYVNAADDSFNQLVEEYHSNMNDYFNDKLKKLVDLVDKDKEFYKHINFKVPSNVNSDNYKEKCGEYNVSSYCVSMGALDLYIAYIEALQGLKGTIPEGTTTVNEAIDEISIRDEDMTSEYENAKTIMEGTISAYNEFKMAYPMHIKYQEIILNLIKYKIELSKITAQTAKFPIKFIDSTSSKCE